jgi:hypothetical protein
MSATAAIENFARVAEQDNYLFNILGLVRSGVRWWVAVVIRIVLAPIVYPLVVIFAQFSPFVIKKHLQTIVPHLPEITDRSSLQWLKDAFTLYYFSLKGYRPFCLFLFRGRLDALLEDLDEEIDSLAFALENDTFLTETIEQIKRG